MNPFLWRSSSGTNCGHPEATFILVFWCWNELLLGSGLNVSVISGPPLWLMSARVTLLVNGHCSNLSYTEINVCSFPCHHSKGMNVNTSYTHICWYKTAERIDTEEVSALVNCSRPYSHRALIHNAPAWTRVWLCETRLNHCCHDYIY